MSLMVRDGKLDVVIVAGPGLFIWPTIGVRTISTLCTEMGLTVGLVGGNSLIAKGMIPLSGTGAVVFAEDTQKRIHRLKARSLVRFMRPDFSGPAIVEPFIGWHSSGMIPLLTAERLFEEARMVWNPAVAILGTGNPALRFGTKLLRSGVPQVICVETVGKWGQKSYAGWEVHKREFEMSGGKILSAQPLQLLQKAPMLWNLKLKNAVQEFGIDVAWVISAGPFDDLPSVREYPPESCLFEIDQTARSRMDQEMEGWILEEERSRLIAIKVVKALQPDLMGRRDELGYLQRRSKQRIRQVLGYREEPFELEFDGKWLKSQTKDTLRDSRVTPKKIQESRVVASLECLEPIYCDLCRNACPVHAIEVVEHNDRRELILKEELCNGCGLCLNVCPASSIVMLEDNPKKSSSFLTISWRMNEPLKTGEKITLLNRRGESLATSRVAASDQGWVRSEVPAHLAWEARSIQSLPDPAFVSTFRQSTIGDEHVEILLNGVKRMVRAGIPVSVALFEIGQNRPEDAALCGDGSCGLCRVRVDGVKKLACQCKVHKGMNLQFQQSTLKKDDALCPCLGIGREDVVSALKQSHLKSPQAVLAFTHYGEGRCHGQLCLGLLRRVLQKEGVDASQWIDFRVPWADWVITPALTSNISG